MRSVLRTLLICLLVLALPAQGAAVATMAFCHGHQPAAAAVAEPNHETPADSALVSTPHEHDHAGALHGHAGHGEPATHDGAGTSSVDAKASRLTQPDPHKCSACAVCCAATATSSTVIKVPAAGLVPTMFSAIIAAVERFAVGGPDRPPRATIVRQA